MLDYYYFEKLERMSRQVQRKFIAEWNAISPMNLSLPQVALLQALSREGIYKVSDLAEVVCITTGGLTLICDKLEEKELIERTRDEVDRRLVYISISPKGRKVVQSIQGLKGELVSRMFEGITMEDMKVMDKVYSTVLRNLEAHKEEQGQD
ncbi:MarR family winged helix-turn-helix transcriptional regulator [Paenibacillus hamazuiensis]|uniref:MarR family winged helix-turn-helix transcriptional regulator n=1 Tax=Paenibacillus hamazuiensis TaxID=2936508 RepID=UPI00200C7D4C|nr:MarR family transcriptional regulator [Paenibacillus hamazuiensis]